MNLGQYGHLGSADILLNYQLGLQAKMIKPGSRVLILNNSPVAAWSTILIKA
jgi:3-oxoacyl-[acyl-carrier-protein] synthase-3